MAHILQVDSDNTAQAALQGILDRGRHACIAVESVTAARDYLQKEVGVDMVILELRLTGENGLSLLKQLKADCLLKNLPVLVYTAQADRHAVKACLDLHVQNFLIKPYEDEIVFAEIAKAQSDPWRNRLFEEKTSFCKLMGYPPAELQLRLEAVRDQTVAAQETLSTWSEAQDPEALLPPAVVALQEAAEAAGDWGVVETLAYLEDVARGGNWKSFKAGLTSLALAAALISHRIAPPATRPATATPSASESRSPPLQNWLSAPAEGRCPMVNWTHLLQQIETLPGCPVIDTAAAAFQMAANGHPSCINPLMDLVARDPGLAAQMLVAANKMRPAAADFNRIEDARLAVGQIGERRLAAEAHKLVTVNQSVMNLPPTFGWTPFWTFQRGVARIAQLICQQLELYSMEPVARAAAQVHDIGKLLLASLCPLGLQATLEYSRRENVPLRTAETLFLGGTTSRMAAHFADHFGLAHRFANVMRWIDDPREATADARLVAVIALARELCRHNKVGASGDPPEPARPITDTPAWVVLSDCVFPSFNVREFEQTMHHHCRQLRLEFAGR